MTIKIGICGALGRMGQAVGKAISENNEFSISATFVRNDNIEKLSDFCLKSDVIIDFSTQEALPNLLEACVNHQTKILVGTTDLSDEHIAKMKKAAQTIAVLHAPNTSIGANLLIAMAGKIAKILPEYDAEIIDLHHKYKKDSPSGTALEIGKNIASSRDQNFKDKAVFGRSNTKIRNDGEIGFSSVRAGSIYGEHEVIFANENEVITIGARALSREIFANGALFAAKWLNSCKQAGFYKMSDVLMF